MVKKKPVAKKKTRPAKKTKAAVPLAAAIAETIEKGPQTLDIPKFVRDAQAVIPDSNEGLAETVTMTEIKTENKLSAKTLVGKAVSEVKELTRLYSVIGIATGIKTGESLYGPWTALSGRFEAKRESDGQVFTAPMVLMPEVVNEVLPSLKTAKAGQASEFAFIVSVEQSEDSGRGYEYVIVSVIEPRESDSLGALRKAIGSYSATSL